MKNVCALLGFVLFFAACNHPVIDSVPEPDLEVVSIGFSKAVYEPDINTNAIVLYFDKTYEYDGIFETYNKQKVLLVENYLREHDFSARWTNYSPKKLTMVLEEGEEIPEKLIFNTGKPCYFYNNYSYYSSSSEKLTYAAIKAKAFIKTPELTVQDRPPGP